MEPNTSQGSVATSVVGKAQARLGFKSQFEHIWRFVLNYKDSIQKITFWFEICLKICEIPYE